MACHHSDGALVSAPAPTVTLRPVNSGYITKAEDGGFLSMILFLTAFLLLY